jgi:eukaryotic-like serine/threonine-protein kinase
MLYEMVTGQPAFSGVTLGDLMNAILRATPVAPSSLRAGIPTTLEVVIARAMQRNPQARYQDAGEMARDLAQCRATVARTRGDATLAGTQAPVDPYAATVIGPVEDVQPAPEGLAPCSAFDCADGLQQLAQAESAAPGVPAAAPASLRWLGWSLAYLAAGAGAVAIAFA